MRVSWHSYKVTCLKYFPWYSLSCPLLQMSLSSPKSIINPYLPRVCFTNKYKHTWNLVWCSCCWETHPLNNHHINTLIRFFSLDWRVLAVGRDGEENRGRGKRMNKVRDDSIRDRHTERQTGEWMCRKKRDDSIKVTLYQCY